MDQNSQLTEYVTLMRWALHTGLRHAEDADPPILAVTTNAESHGQAGFKGMIDGILFSRRFILSYQLVLLCLLLLFGLLHWSARIYARRRSKRNKQRINLNTGRSSSSTTLYTEESYSAPPIKLAEQTPLLHPQISDHGKLHLLSYRTRAWLVYQPSPIPIINKSLPSNGCTLLVLVFLALQVFYTFYNVTLSIPLLFVFADRTAMVFVANLPLLYLFAAKNQPIKLLTGNSYETLNIFHRRLGEVMCLLALLHSVGMVGVWYTILRPVGLTFAGFLVKKIILLGLGALVAYEVMYFTSLASFRQRWYELFLGTHVLLQSIGLVLLFFHHHGSRPYVAIALVIFLADRLVYRIILKRWIVNVALEVKEDRRTVSISAMVPFKWRATDHMFLSIPSLARKHWIQAHPFTIASPAPKSSDPQAQLKLLVKAHDGFSKDLLRYAQNHCNTIARVDGPYGSQSAVHMLQETDLAIIVSAGSGIAVGIPLLYSVIKSRGKSDVEASTSLARYKSILFVWTVRQKSQHSWIEQSEIEFFRAAGVNVMIPPPTESQGRFDINDCIHDWVVSHNVALKRSVGIVCSAPDGMNRVVRNTASELIYNGYAASVMIEKFGW